MSTPYTPSPTRYDRPSHWFRPCGRWGLKLPAISLGCWHNFGEDAEEQNCRALLFTAFDHGITHFDLANNYGPPPGSAESRVGKILKQDLRGHRHELVISTKAGFLMWPGPYGEWGSRKYLLTSLDQSLRRLDLDYVDIFYHHRPDPSGGTPLDETFGALDQAVRSGKAIYAGISNYSGALTAQAATTCRKLALTVPIIHQPYYNMLSRGVEADLLPVTARLGIGVIAFCPLAQGLLTDRYLEGIPADSRAASKTGFLKRDRVTPEVVAKAKKLSEVAQQRGQTLAQLALAWTLRLPEVTTALIGASKPQQITQNVAALDGPALGDEELKRIDAILAS